MDVTNPISLSTTEYGITKCGFLLSSVTQYGKSSAYEIESYRNPPSSAINCRVAGVAYYTTNLDEDEVANVFESSRDSGYLDTTGTPANLWTIISSYPTTTWTATSGADNLTAENAVALTQEDLSLYWF